MDIWKWVADIERDLREAGNTRLADLIYAIPENANANRPELVSAAIPEALAGARALNNQWLEVYFRHWSLNNRMGDMVEGEKALPEVVSLLEFAHREDTLACPQSVCATQDIAMCYGNIDGPGWVPERLAVCEETLARINPEWSCFNCISNEYASALLDADRATDTLEFMARQTQALQEAGETPNEQMQRIIIRALRMEGHIDAALQKLDEIEADEQRDARPDDRQSCAILRASLLAANGDFEGAWKALPKWEELKPGNYPEWSRTAFTIAKENPEYNQWPLGSCLQKSLDYLSGVGAHRHSVEVALRHLELALARQANWCAQRALQLAQTHVLKLRRPQDLAPAVARWADFITLKPRQIALPVPAADLATHLRAQEGASPEHDLELLLQACHERPLDADLASFAARALLACGNAQDAKAHLWQFVRSHPTVDGPNYQLLGQLLNAGDYADIAQLASEVAPANPLMALWCQCQTAFAQKRWPEACAHLAEYVQACPDSRGARDLWAQAALAHQDLSTALRLRQALASETEAGTPEYRNSLWDLLSAASAAQDWATVRETAPKLGMKLDASDNPGASVEENWGNASIELTHPEPQRRFARRTGPVTARILSHANAPDVQHLDDWVVFDASPLEAAPEDENERAQFIHTYRAVHVIEEGGFGPSCFCDGAFAGEAAFAVFSEALAAQGWALRVTSDDNYTVKNPDSFDEAATLPGRYFQVAAPRALTPKEVDLTLHELTSTWTHPVCWPRFSDNAGIDTQWHRDIVERYAL